MIEKIKPKSLSKLNSDLNNYVKLSIEHGATEAKIIDNSNIIVDPRVQLKCHFPKCSHFGSNAHCPPHVMDVDKIKKAAELYEYAILIMLKVPPEKMLSGADEKGKVADRRKIAEIISTVEGAAFYDGHYLAMGFGAGSCKMTWCPKVPCQVLESGTCRVPLKSRPSMESVGFDVFRMAANVGWDIRPVGTHCKIEKIPHALRIGLILVE